MPRHRPHLDEEDACPEALEGLRVFAAEGVLDAAEAERGGGERRASGEPRRRAAPPEQARVH
jgi:hypothetical protein